MTKKVGTLFFSFDIDLKFIIIFYSSVHSSFFSSRAKFEQFPPGYEVGSWLHRERLRELYRFHPSIVSNGAHDHEL